MIALPTFKMTSLKLTISDGDQRAHTIVIGTHRARVPAGGHVVLDIHHLVDGTHVVGIDGHAGGELTCGSAGGP